MTQWIKHDGGPMPVHPETVVSVRSNTGWEEGLNVYVAHTLPWVFMTSNAGFEYTIIRAHPDCPSLKNTAVDMARAGIAPSVKPWKCEDVGETWRVWSGECEYFTAKESDAQWLAYRLNGKA